MISPSSVIQMYLHAFHVTFFTAMMLVVSLPQQDGAEPVIDPQSSNPLSMSPEHVDSDGAPHHLDDSQFEQLSDAL